MDGSLPCAQEWLAKLLAQQQELARLRAAIEAAKGEAEGEAEIEEDLEVEEVEEVEEEATDKELQVLVIPGLPLWRLPPAALYPFEHL